jgi:hypothetical protein
MFQCSTRPLKGSLEGPWLMASSTKSGTDVLKISPSSATQWNEPCMVPLEVRKRQPLVY